MASIRSAISQQGIGALGRGGSAPGIGGRMGRIQGLIEVGRRGARRLAVDLAGHRGDIVEVLALQRSNPLAADEVFIAALESKQGIVAAGHGVLHGTSPGVV